MGVGHVKVRQHRALPEGADLKTVTVKREGSGRRARWFVVIPVTVTPTPLAPSGAITGIDMGIASFATTSEGKFLPNPRFGRTAAAKLAAAQRVLSGRKRGSGRRFLSAQRYGDGARSA